MIIHCFVPGRLNGIHDAFWRLNIPFSFIEGMDRDDVSLVSIDGGNPVNIDEKVISMVIRLDDDVADTDDKQGMIATGKRSSLSDIDGSLCSSVRVCYNSSKSSISVAAPALPQSRVAFFCSFDIGFFNLTHFSSSLFNY